MKIVSRAVTIKDPTSGQTGTFTTQDATQAWNTPVRMRLAGVVLEVSPAQLFQLCQETAVETTVPATIRPPAEDAPTPDQVVEAAGSEHNPAGHAATAAPAAGGPAPPPPRTAPGSGG